MSSQLRLAVDAGVAVRIFVVFNGDPVEVDRIENVSLGDRLEAHEEGRETLHSCALWSAVHYHRARELERLIGAWPS